MTSMHRRAFLRSGGPVFLVVLVLGCSPHHTASLPYTSNSRGLDPRNLDPSVSPCTDFYQYANGGWLARNPVPPDRPASALLLEMIDRTAAVLQQIADRAAADADAEPPGSITQKVGHYYSAALDEGTLTALGARPIRRDLDLIDGMESPSDLPSVVTQFHAQGLPFLFESRVLPDFNAPDTMLLYVGQGGLGLPDRDFYVGEGRAELRAAYVAHIARMMQLLGDDPERAMDAARTVMAVETELAEAALGAVELRDLGNFYRPVPVARADSEAPRFPTSGYVSGLGLEADRISFPHLRYFAAVDRMLGEHPLEDWKAYLRWHLVREMAPHLSPEFEAAHFEFFGRALNGTESMPERRQRALDRTTEALSEALGRLYVAEVFPPEAKVLAERMVADVQAAMQIRLRDLGWMGEATREHALRKLGVMKVMVGYPDTWIDYSTLHVMPGDAYGNARRARAFEKQRNLDELGRPRDRSQWQTPPQSYSGFYSPLTNVLIFPTGSLQPPLFDVGMDDAVNYGATGANIGHELIHGFDDQGSRFDGSGQFSDWWTPEDRAEFARRAQRLVRQYGGYEPLPGLFVNGELTLSENIADLGGLMVAYDAFRAALARNPVGEIDGLAPDQRFFLSYAQSYRRNLRDEYLRNVVTTDPHAPAPFRTNGVVSHMPEFAAAFGCRAGDPMVLPDSLRVSVW